MKFIYSVLMMVVMKMFYFEFRENKDFHHFIFYGICLHVNRNNVFQFYVSTWWFTNDYKVARFEFFYFFFWHLSPMMYTKNISSIKWVLNDYNVHKTLLIFSHSKKNFIILNSFLIFKRIFNYIPPTSITYLFT